MLHLLAITIGLLIALGLEAGVEWIHHRHLVREARENIAQEIRDNQKNLAKELAVLPQEESQLERLMGVVGDLEHGRASKPDKMVWSVTRLSDSSWNTAFSTGAVAHMDYDEVRRYSQLYALQQMFNSTMDHYLESRRDMYAFLARIQLPDKPPESEWETGKRVIAEEAVTGQFLLEISNTLQDRYSKFRSEAN
jgi:hypothetical protein